MSNDLHQSVILHKYILTRKMPVGEKVVMTSHSLDHIQRELKEHPDLILHCLNDDHGGYDPIELESLSEYTPET